MIIVIAVLEPCGAISWDAYVLKIMIVSPYDHDKIIYNQSIYDKKSIYKN